MQLPPEKILVMGICNVTPDSFSDGGKFYQVQAAVDHARAMVKQGARLIDIGGESTRPGAAPLDPLEEQARILPVIHALRDCGAMLSVDTRNAATMRAALDAGAHMINDISALRGEGALDVVARATGPVCLMHMQGTPENMQDNPVYDDVVEDVFAWLQNRIETCVAHGIAHERIIADPGFGFGKTYDHNIAMLENFGRFTALGVPVLCGLSRKRFIARMMGGDPAPEQRDAASAMAAVTAAGKGARILRVHNVAATMAALAKSED